MKVKKKRCQFCGCWYKPDPRTARFQKTCSKETCRKARERQKNRNWTARNPDYQSCRSAKVRAWAVGSNYWKRYRASHPEYVRRDNRRRVLSRKRHKVSAKQTTISQITVEKLNDIRKKKSFLSAKQTAIDRRVDGLIELLIWKEQSAKQTDIALGGASLP